MITPLLQSKLHTGTKRPGIFKMLCLLALNIGLAGSLMAQTTTVTIPVPYEDTAPEANGGSTSNTRQPLTNFQKFERSAAIYTAGEIGQTGTITAIAYDLKSVDSPQPSQVQVYLKAVPLNITSFSAGATVAGELSGATLVYDEVLSYPASVPVNQSNWILLDFDVVDFPYNHTTNNLEVIVVTSNPCTSCQFGADFSSSAKLSRFNDNLSNAFLFELDSPTATPPQFFRAITNFRPNIQLTITTSTPTCATPTAASPSTSNVTQTTATVNFTPVAGQSAYQITYTPTGTQTQPVTNTGNSFNLTGLTAGTLYNYEIRTNCSGTLSNALTGNFTTQSAPTPVCEAPTNVSVTSPSANTLTVSYTASGGLAGDYFLEYGATTVQLTSNPQTITSVPAGTYNFTVYKMCGTTRVNGTPTGSVIVNDPSPTPVCEAPTNVSVTSPSANTLTVSYTASGGLAGDYFLEYGATTVQLTSNPQTITSVPAGTYNFTVYKMCGTTRVNGTPTGSVIVNDPSPTPVCEAPTNVSVTSPSANTLTVSYTASGGLAGDYFLEYGATTVQLTSNPQTITSVPAGTYNFTVYKMCGTTRVNGTPTGSVIVNDPSPTPVCEAPTNVSVTSPSANTLTVSYTASGGLAGDYFLEYGATTVQLTSNPQTITSVPAGTYNFTVYKMCGTTRVNGTPTGSVIVNDPSPTPVCEAPTNVSVTSPSANTLTVSYTASGGLAGDYFLEYGATTVQLTSNPQTITSVPAGTYNFTVYKMCGTTRVNGTPTGSVIVNDPSQPCNPPTAGSATSNNFNELTVSYTASSTGAAGNYFIAFTPTGGGTTTTVALTSNPQTITSVPAGTYNFTIYKDCSGVQSTGNPTGTFTVQDAPLPPVCTTGTWLGTTSTDWHTASNWCNGIIPDGSTNVIIPANTGGNPVPNYPVITLNALANNLTIQTNATLTLASGVLTINGLYTNLGTLIDNGDGSLVFTSPTPQTLGKPGQTVTFLDLTTGPGGIIQGGPVRIRRVLTLNGNMTTLGNELTLLADNAVQSMVVNNGSAVIIGNATMEKYINPGNNPSFGYRHLASPVSNATISQLNDDTPLIVNPAYNTNPTPGTTVPFPNIYRYNETRLDLPIFTAPNFDTGWESPNDLNEVMPPAVGYTVNMLPVEIDFTGTLNNGPYTRTLTRGNQPRSGYNFLGNPYPAPINWDLVSLPPNMDRAAYVVRSTGQYTGTYVAYVNGIPANGEYIAAMQGFFVRLSTPNSAASITFENDDRVTTYENPALYKKAETRPVITLALRNTAGVEDKTYVYFESGATVNFDGNFDAFKMPHTGPVPSIFSRAGNDQLAINGLPLSATNTIIPLGGKVPQAGTWTIAADQIINFLPGQTIYLEDIATNTMHNLGQQNSYTFSTTQTDLSGRFFLRFGPGAVTGITPAELAAKVQVYPNPNHGQFTISMPALNATVVEAAIFNAVGQKVWSKALQTDGLYLKETITTQKLAPGVYSLRLETNAGPVQRKIIIE